MFDNLVSEVLLEVHSTQNLPSQLVLGLLFTTSQYLSGSLAIHLCSLLLELSYLFLLLFSLVIKQGVVFDCLTCAFARVVFEQVLRVEQIHKTHIDVVLKSPDPFANKTDSELSSDAIAISSHH